MTNVYLGHVNPNSENENTKTKSNIQIPSATILPKVNNDSAINN